MPSKPPLSASGRPLGWGISVTPGSALANSLITEIEMEGLKLKFYVDTRGTFYFPNEAELRKAMVANQKTVSTADVDAKFTPWIPKHLPLNLGELRPTVKFLLMDRGRGHRDWAELGGTYFKEVYSYMEVLRIDGRKFEFPRTVLMADEALGHTPVVVDSHTLVAIDTEDMKFRCVRA